MFLAYIAVILLDEFEDDETLHGTCVLLLLEALASGGLTWPRGQVRFCKVLERNA